MNDRITAEQTAGRARPNIVLIMTDQQRLDSIAALGNDHVDTPNLDRLVREGVALNNTYVASPSCAPSRASLFTGLYPHTSGVYRNDDVWRHSWVEDLAASGYRCASVGKMHTYPYEAYVGFHERHVVENKDRGVPDLPYFLDNWDKAIWVRGHVKPDRPWWRGQPGYDEALGAFVFPLEEDLHADAFVGGLARRWLETYPVHKDEPVFLQIGFPGPHPPYDPPARHLAAYENRAMPPVMRTPEELAAHPDVLKELRRRHFAFDFDCVVHQPEPSDEQLQRQRRHYYANVTLIDEQVGKLIDTLHERGMLENTVIVFTSDHGDSLNDHGLSQKWNMYEESVKVPAIIWAPGRVRAGVVSDALVSLMDLGPTILELAGLVPPAWMEARSLLPLAEGSADDAREHVFSEHARDFILTGTAMMTMVRDARYKLVEFVDSDQGQLFDLERDPREMENLWGHETYAPHRARLQKAIARWRVDSAVHTATWAAQYR